MKIVFSGAAGIGKTTTAQALADALNIPLLPENMEAQVAATRQWLKVSQAGSDAERAPAWKQFLRTHIDWMNERAKQMNDVPDFVADRWTVDLLAQWLASGNSKRDNALTDKLIKHFQAQAAKIDLVVMLPLRIDLKNQANEMDLPRSASLSDQLMLHCLIRGLLQQLTRVPVVYLPSGKASVEERVKLIQNAIAKVQQRKSQAAQPGAVDAAITSV